MVMRRNEIKRIAVSSLVFLGLAAAWVWALPVCADHLL